MVVYKSSLVVIVSLHIICGRVVSTESSDDINTIVNRIRSALDELKAKNDMIKEEKIVRHGVIHNHHRSDDYLMNFDRNKECADASRITYQECLLKEKSFYSACSKLFVQSFPGCFFHDTMKDRTDAPTCRRHCLLSSDRCMLASRNTEQILCIAGRRTCLKLCPSENFFDKRDCYGNCAGEYTQCEHLITQISEIMICQVNRQLCQTLC